MKKTLIDSVLIGIGSSIAFAVAIAQAGQQTQQNPAPQQTSIIEGSVTRAGSSQPLKGARVSLVRSDVGQNRLTAALAEGNARGGLALAALTGVGAAASVIADGNGKFTITGVAPGQYRITADREGFIRNEYGQRTPTGDGAVISIAANQRLTVELHMIQASVMSGRVITSDGEAASNHTVSAHTYQYANGERSLAQVATARTNDLGEYRLFWLEPGDYFVSVTNDILPEETAVGAVDVAQSRGRGNREGIVLAAIGGRGGVLAEALGSGNPPIYYPGTLDPSNAIPVSVAASAEVRGVDFNLRPLRAATVSGRVTAPFPISAANPVIATGPRGRGANAGAAVERQALRPAGPPIQVNLNRIGSGRAGLGALLGLRLGSTLVNADGSFEIKGVSPGEYNLLASTRDANGQEYSARSRVSVGTADVANVVAALRPGVEVTGRIILSGTPPAQFRMTNLRVSLVTGDGAGQAFLEFRPAAGGRGNAAANLEALTGGQVRSEAVLEDGSFTLKNVGSMEYRVQVTGLPQGAYVQVGHIGSNDALNSPFTVDDPQSLLQLQIAFSPGRVAGVVTDSRGMPTPGAQAVLVPDEARRGRNDSYFNATTNQNGQFNFNNVPPGSYKFFAWESVPAGAYQYPDFIRRYEDRGQTLTVSPNGSTTVEGKLIPAS